MTDITQTEDANHLLTFVDYRQSADLELLHVPNSFGEIIVLPAAMNAWRHDVTRGGALRIEVVLGQPFANDVAVGHHADQPVVLPDRNGAYVMLAHQFREVGDRRVRADPVDASVHHFFDFHGWTSVFGVDCANAPLLDRTGDSGFRYHRKSGHRVDVIGDYFL